MNSAGRRLVGVLLFTLSVAQAGWAKSYGALDFTACRLPAPAGVRAPAAYCAQLQVPEDWQSPSGRQIQLAIAWLPARAKKPASAPLVLLAGGPGQAARETFSALLPAYHPIRATHHLLLVDQRGTGDSAPIDCPPLHDDVDESKGPEAGRSWVQDCVAQHSGKQDLAQYHTQWAVRDLDAVRSAIGVDVWNLLGVSYGTRVAQRYAERFPHAVGRLVLDGVVPNDIALGVDDDINLDRAVRAQLQRCNEDADCHTRFGPAYEKLAAFAAKLEHEPQLVQVRHPRQGQRMERRLDKALLASWVRVMAYAPELIPLMPWTLHQAEIGDAAPLVAQAWMIEEMLKTQISPGMQLSVICNERVAILAHDPAVHDSSSLLFQRLVDEDMRSLCAHWPKAPPQSLELPKTSRLEMPTLLLSGQYDPVTPPSYGTRAATNFSRARHLILRGQSHGVAAVGCVPELIADFLVEGIPEKVDDTCLQKLEPPPFFLHAQGTTP